MSKETLTWLNQNVLIGMTDKRGNAWHYKASEQGAEANHYAGAIPIDDVRRRLFNFKALEVPMYVAVPTNDGSTVTYEEVPNKQAIVRDDTYKVLGVNSTSYTPHQYDEWLLTAVSSILDDDLVIGSAGLLKGGSIAWVQVEMPESMIVADVEYRPNLLATTSFNGSIATTYKRTVTVVVCDNTREMALQENGQTLSIRHTANSVMRLADARSALNIVHQMSDEFGKEIERLLSDKVSEKRYDSFLNKYITVHDKDSKMAVTRAENTRNEFIDLWHNDVRVAPWRGTAFGVMQAVNTHFQHVRPTRGNTMRLERTMMDTLTGKNAVTDIKAMHILASV